MTTSNSPHPDSPAFRFWYPAFKRNLFPAIDIPTTAASLLENSCPRGEVKRPLKTLNLSPSLGSPAKSDTSLIPATSLTIPSGSELPLTVFSPNSSEGLHGQSQESLREQAIEASYNHNQTLAIPKHFCARGVWNLAKNYVDYLKSEKIVNESMENAGGNANQSSFWNNLEKIGYRKQIITVNPNTTASITSKVQHGLTYELGDILVYWSSHGDGAFSKHGHTQIYVGSSSASGWETDPKADNNYNTFFVYKSKKSTSWNLIFFKAPAK